MSTLNWSLKQINGDNAFFTTNATNVYKDGQFILNTQTKSIYVGDGVTALSGLTVWGGNTYTAGNGLTLNGSVFELGGTLTKNTTISGAFDLNLNMSTITLGQGTINRILGTNASNQIEYKATTGSGSVVLATSPTFTTDITAPILYGSSASGGNLTLESTSNATKGRIIFSGVGTNNASIQGLVGTTTIPAIYMGVATPSATNYSIWGNGDSLILNTPGANAVAIRSANNQIVTFSNTAFSFAPRVATTGSVNSFSFSVPANTGQTASTAVPGTLFTYGQRTWANGGVATTITFQKEFEIRAPQYATSGGGSLNFTDVATLYIETPNYNGTTSTRNYGIATNGNIRGSVYYTGATAGVSGTFTTTDAKTVTVTNGIITSIV